MSAENVRNHYRRQGAEQRQQEVIALLQDRFDDLESCHKNDNCRELADIIQVVISDITDNFQEVANSRHAEAKELEVIPEKPDSSN